MKNSNENVIYKYYDPPSDSYMTREELDKVYGELYRPGISGCSSWSYENPDGSYTIDGERGFLRDDTDDYHFKRRKACPLDENLFIRLDDIPDPDDEEEEPDEYPYMEIKISYYKFRELVDPFTISFFNYEIFKNEKHPLHNTMKYAIVLFNREQYPYDIKSRFNYELNVKDYKEFFGSFFPTYMVKRTVYNDANLYDKCSFENFHLIIE